MARKAELSPVAEGRISGGSIGNIQGALIHGSRGYSNYNALLVGASLTFLAIPPVKVLGSVSNHLLLQGMPTAVRLYRDDPYYLAFNTVVSSLVGAWVPGGISYHIPLNPGLQHDTIAVTAVDGTSPLRVVWEQ